MPMPILNFVKVAMSITLLLHIYFLENTETFYTHEQHVDFLIPVKVFSKKIGSKHSLYISDIAFLSAKILYV